MLTVRLLLAGTLTVLLSGQYGAPALADTRAGGTAAPPPAAPDPDVVKAKQQLDDVVVESVESSGALFKTPEQIIVKQPLLSALITLNANLSPFQLDGSMPYPIGLRETLRTALSRSLAIKLVETYRDQDRWNYVASLGNFLPTISNAISFQGLKGAYVSPAGQGVVIPINNPYLTTESSYSLNLFKGGSIVYGMLQSKHQWRASSFAYKGSINDVLLEATELYYNMVHNHALLQIRIKAVETAKALYIVTQDLFDNGVVSKVELLQAKSQLSRERQALIAQQVKRREASIRLARALNLDTGLDLIPAVDLVAKARLVDEGLTIADLLNMAIDCRPELKQYEELRLAAKDAVKVARAALLPTVATTGTIIGAGSNAGLNFNSFATALSGSGFSGGAITGSGALPLSSSSAGAKKWQARAAYTMAVTVNWKLGGMALTEAAQVQAAKAQSRRAQIEFSQKLQRVYEEVRDAYLKSMSAEALIAETTDAVNWAEEELRVAQLRFQEGIGTNLDVVNAQREYVDALVHKADAIISYNTAQARILRSIGKISSDTLTGKRPLRS